MPIETLLPNSTEDGGSSTNVFNAATVHEALASPEDDVLAEGSGVEVANSIDSVDVGFESHSISSSAEVAWIRHRIAARLPQRSDNISFTLVEPKATVYSTVSIINDQWTYYNSSLRYEYVNGDPIVVDDINSFVSRALWGTTGSTEIDLGYLELQIKWNEKPVPTIDSPTGTGAVTDTSKPTVEWSYDPVDSDSDPQGEFELRIYDEADVPATPPTNPDDISASPVYTASTETSSTSHDLTEDLQNDTTYRIYLRVRKDWAGEQDLWSDWTNDTFSTDYNQPAAPNFTVNLVSSPYEHAELVFSDGAGGDVPADYFRLWYRDDSNDDWTEIANEIQAGTYLDPTIIPNVEREYRARAYSEASGLPVASSSEFDTLTISTHENWTLIDPEDVNNYLDLDVEMDELPMPYAQDASVFNPFGNEDDDLTPPVVVLGDVRTPEITMNVGTVGQPDYKTLVALHRAQKTLMLRTPIPEDARFVRFGNTFTPVLKNSNDLYRVTEFNLHQTARPEDLEVTQ